MRADTRHLLIATAPAALIGIWNLGGQIAARPGNPADDWQLALIGGFGVTFESPGVVSAFATGAAFWLPLLAVALAISWFWANLFARRRSLPTDQGWLPQAWIFSLLLPATMPLGFAALALSFGLVFGCHAFGGSHRYLVHPSLLAIVFVAFAYPALVDASAWLPGGAPASTWSVAAAAAANGTPAIGPGLTDALIGREVGAIGTTPAALCLLGALYLISVRRASAAVVGGAIIAIIAAGTLIGDLSGPMQLALGNFAFALAFIATDPTTRPRSAGSRWIFGALFGLLTVVVRTADPAHPEGTWAALLLASLAIPLIDRLWTGPGPLDLPAAAEANGVPE
jgi:Na+-transporting NADH:ubiquinone oxidoreductase subunit B